MASARCRSCGGVFSRRSDVRVFGNVAVALAACAITENDAARSRGVEALLLVRDDSAWRIVAQAWDAESGTQPIPEHLAGGRGRI